MEQEQNPQNNKIQKFEMFAQSPELALFDMLDTISGQLEEIASKFKDLDLSNVEELKGDKPEKGVDYFTEEEIEEIKEIIAEEATPVKGVHYFDGEDADVDSIKQELMMYIDERLGQTQPTEEVIIDEPNPTLK